MVDNFYIMRMILIIFRRFLSDHQLGKNSPSVSKGRMDTTFRKSRCYTGKTREFPQRFAEASPIKGWKFIHSLALYKSNREELEFKLGPFFRFLEIPIT
ncbi:Uncharacterized protein XB16_2616 [Leptospira santarosai]|uniref:Uncharacterized protein n=1 Tax=Leptospira santarosai TaxID=28183 RepID=A0A2P1QVJ1_9LEPT|nr:Uncharacterized protein XB16_2616 [Leptospira santarosai]